MILSQISIKFIIGIILLTTNGLVGLSGIGVCLYYVRKTGKKKFYAIATGIYFFSWVMLITGAVLVGPEGILVARELIHILGWKFVPIALLISVLIVYALIQENNERKEIKEELK